MTKIKIYFLFSFLLVMTWANSNGQGKLSGGPIVAKFLGTNYYVFNTSIGFNLQYNDGLIFGVDFMKFTPKKDTFYFMESDVAYGTLVYNDYYVVPFYVGIDWDLELTDKLFIVPGIVSGYYMVFYEYDYEGIEGSIGDSYIGGKVGMSPKVRIKFETDSGFLMYLEGKYNGMLEINSTDLDNESITGGPYHHYLTFGFGIGFNFE